MSNVIIKKSQVLLGFALLLMGAILYTFAYSYTDVPNEKIIINQQLWTGRMAYWVDPGVQIRLGRNTEYYKTNQVWFNEVVKTETDYHTMNLKNPAFPIRYADKGSGYVLGSVRIEMPTSRDKLSLIQQHYGSERRLIVELIEPTIGKVILACGPLMTSLESVSERRNDLIAYATDQLNSGVYITRPQEVEKINSITGEMEKFQQAFIVYDTLGIALRQEISPFDFYGLKVSQLSIADLVYDGPTMDQIDRQRSANLEIITAKAEAAKAQQKTIQVREEGIQAAEKARWDQEIIKAKEVTEASQRYEVMAFNARTAAEEAKKIEAEGRAKALANQLLVQAGLTPLERATIEKETRIGVAAAMANWKPPTIVMGGGTGGSSPMDPLMINQYLQVVKQLSQQ
jgi:regulator of protease activity HflC (stomatin/prohibitin superfamily)